MHHLPNLVHLCRTCHGRATFGASWGYQRGLLVPHRDALSSPCTAPLRLTGRLWVHLTESGAYRLGCVPLRHLGQVFDLLAALDVEGIGPSDAFGPAQPPVPAPAVVEESGTGEERKSLIITVTRSGVERCLLQVFRQDKAHGLTYVDQQLQAVDGVWHGVDPIRDEPQVA